MIYDIRVRCANDKYNTKVYEDTLWINASIKDDSFVTELGS